MNRFAILVLFSLSAMCLQAQTGLSGITISTQPSGARFAVDGQTYSQAQTFVWPAGSKHLLVFVTDPPLPNQSSTTQVQTSPDGATQYVFTGWIDNAGLILPISDPVQTITADPHITTLTAKLTVSYQVFLNYFNSSDPSLPVTCGAPGAIPPGQFRPGIIFIGSTCYWASATVFVPAGSTTTLNAFPYPGFVFLGWQLNYSSPDYLQSIVVNGPITIAPHFSPGKRVQFVSSPPALQVLVDRTTVPTRSNPDVTVPCTERYPVSTVTGFPTLCFGDFDFAAGTVHTVGGVTPQLDKPGNYWVYNSWSSVTGQSGTGPSSNYAADSNLSASDTVTVNFVPGAHVGFLTSPSGLKLTVDGRSNFPSYDFIWGLGSTHQVSAPATQADKNGRQYTYKGWSNNGAASQTVNVDQSAVTSGLLLTASYSVLSRVLVQSTPSGLSLQVDGVTCQTPCTVDRQNGSQLRVTAPSTIALGDSARLDLQNWSDGGTADHTFTVNTDYSTVTATYRNSYRLGASSDPANGVSYQFDPSSPDMFYSQDTPVTITATAGNGFKFRRWGGDLSGTYPAGVLTMSTPHSVVALLDRVPFIAPAGVRNAVGDTPSSSVAAGSIITIYGESLAPVLQVGRVNPLAQTIAGVTVTVNDRILPLLYVAPTQINAEIPSDLPPGDYTLQVHSQGQPDVSATFTVVRDAPGLFTMTVNSQQYAMAFHADGSLVTPDSPAQAGETVSLLGTGFGPYNGFTLDGFFPPDPPPTATDPVSISAGTQSPSPAWVGAAPGYSGITATKFTVPTGMPVGTTVPVSVNVNGVASNTVMLPLQ
jgi:uncharacterized protein (TIGR03437 family)